MWESHGLRVKTLIIVICLKPTIKLIYLLCGSGPVLHLNGVGPWSDVLQDARSSQLVHILHKAKFFKVLVLAKVWSIPSWFGVQTR